MARSWVPEKKNTAADIIILWLIYDDFLFYIDNGMLFVFIIRTHNIPSFQRKSKKYPYYAAWAGAMINTH